MTASLPQEKRIENNFIDNTVQLYQFTSVGIKPWNLKKNVSQKLRNRTFLIFILTLAIFNITGQADVNNQIHAIQFIFGAHDIAQVLGKFICNGKKLMIRSSLIRVGSDFNARPHAPNSEKKCYFEKWCGLLQRSNQCFSQKNFFQWSRIERSCGMRFL